MTARGLIQYLRERADGLARLDWALADKPDLVILALGANDALRGIEPSTVRDNLDKMIEKIQASGAKLLLVGMLAPPNWGAEYKQAFDRIFPELARIHHVPLYPFFLDGISKLLQCHKPPSIPYLSILNELSHLSFLAPLDTVPYDPDSAQPKLFRRRMIMPQTLRDVQNLILLHYPQTFIM